jgi:hypothetical protein
VTPSLSQNPPPAFRRRMHSRVFKDRSYKYLPIAAFHYLLKLGQVKAVCAAARFWQINANSPLFDPRARRSACSICIENKAVKCHAPETRFCLPPSGIPSPRPSAHVSEHFELLSLNRKNLCSLVSLGVKSNVNCQVKSERVLQPEQTLYLLTDDHSLFASRTRVCVCVNVYSGEDGAIQKLFIWSFIAFQIH